MTKEEIGAVLKQLRLACNMTQKEVAEKIGRRQQVVGHWETGYAQPDANTLFTLCDIYNTTVDKAFGFSQKKLDVKPDEYEHIKKYRKLDAQGLEVVNYIIDNELKRIEQISLSLSAPASYRTLAYFHRLASAGSGEYLFYDIPSDNIRVPDSSEAAAADFAIGVYGDSMAPFCSDGDVLLVKRQEEIEKGQVGVFMLDGQGYVKRLGKNELISDNPKYDNVKLNDFNIVKCAGLVVGRLAASEIDFLGDMESPEDKEYENEREQFIKSANRSMAAFGGDTQGMDKIKKSVMKHLEDNGIHGIE